MGKDILEKGLEFIEWLDKLGNVGRRWLVRSEDSTDPRYGCVPTERPMEEAIRKGLLVIDKPPGPTSHEVVAWIKRMFGVEKAGHGGTLEPDPHYGGWAGRS